MAGSAASRQETANHERARTTVLVVTSINPETAALRALASGATSRGIACLVIGDDKGPRECSIAGLDYWNMDRQLACGIAFAKQCPTRHYARKNLGYLLAIRRQAEVIQETDDDNFPLAAFWEARSPMLPAARVQDAGWCNVYRYFTGQRIWPRGFPLDRVDEAPPARSTLRQGRCHAPIQQGLADANPDVDAVYRLLFPLPVTFRRRKAVALVGKTYCPFNSQNTTWFPPAFPLLYLPAFCSFRMTDIWRSFVAQRICRENDWAVCFHSATVYQERNAHVLLRDFKDEVEGYLHNAALMELLDGLALQGGALHVKDDMFQCYKALVDAGHVHEQELPLLDCWLSAL